ncbi:DUF5683 domain-containing protein [Methanococcus voltae]|uniref:TM2 domain containing protein n=1 Tax=Methanococcus voltae (strain ATCC BAA-1334 / A3) TaxID=456320 RepID=D7DR76_METV3|nr:DUF5683 domain-containing protein [Methanococcus voltae]MCS3901013.1 TM2 domain-containing membrane protein YozV [Methanococcus voltae]
MAEIKYCQHCGFKLENDEDVCPQCNKFCSDTLQDLKNSYNVPSITINNENNNDTNVTSASDSQSESESDSESEAKNTNISSNINKNTNMGYPAGFNRYIKSPALAAILSFFIPGLGQIYNGEIIKGIIIIVLFVISFFAIAILIGFIMLPIVWLYAVCEAYNTANKINRGYIVP